MAEGCTPTPVGGKFFRGLTVHRDNLAAAIKHNLRHKLPGHPCPKDADPSRTSLNEVLAGIDHPDEGEAFIAACRDGIELPTRSNATTSAIEFLFSAPPRMQNPDAFLRACVEWVTAHTDMPLISAVVHRDQGAPHCHVLMLPVMGGKWVGSRAIERERLKAMHAAFDKAVGKPFGLKGAKSTRAALQAAYAYVIERITTDPEALLQCLPALDAAAMRDPAAFLDCWGDGIERFEAKATTTVLFTRKVGGSREQEQRIAQPPGITSRAAVRGDESAIAQSESAIAVRESAIAGASAELLHRDSTSVARQVLQPMSPPPRPVLTLVHTTPRPAPVPAPRAPTEAPAPALADKPPRCPPMTPALRAELDLQAVPAKPSPDYLAYMRFHEWRTEQRRLQKLAKRERQAAKAATH